MQRALTGFAAGVMVVASIWSLLMMVLAVTLHNIPEGMAVGKISFFIPSSCDIMIIRYIINQNSINQKLRRIHNERKNGDYFHADKINPACFRRVAFTC